MENPLPLMKARHSYRGAFLPTPVSRETLAHILEAGRAAPSGCFKQSARFIAIDDPAIMKGLVKILHGKDGTAPDTVQTAQAFILVVHDATPAYGNMSFGAEDCAAAVTNMLNAITAAGLASVWLDGALRGENAAALSRFLNIPPPFSARILLPIGVPKEPGQQPPRKPAAQRIGWNTFTPEMR